jgi:phage tail sheath protein FI
MATPPENLTTPGVYVTEFDAFPSSVVGVPTAVPAFIGYTQKAIIGGKPAFLQPIQITSLADYQDLFGAGFKPLYDIVAVTPTTSPAPANWDFQVGSSYFKLQQAGGARFNLYNSMRLFFANGGGNCYVVSVGDYTNQGQSPGGVTVEEADLISGITAIGGQAGPTMLVIPDAVLLPTIGAFSGIAQAMLAQCGELQDRVAILDVYGAETINPGNVAAALDQVISNFQDSVGNNSLGYGAAYLPLLNTAVAQPGDVDYTNFNPQPAPGVSTAPGGTLLQFLLEEAAGSLYSPGTASRATVQQYIDDITVVVPDPTDPDNTQRQQQITSLNQNLSIALPPYQQWQSVIIQRMNVVPPSGAMAGVFTASDQTSGVWNAPANVSLAAVASLSVNLNDNQQAQLNMPLNGKAVDVIREFASRGPVVWGARTLDGNSNDWRYIQIRRTIVYIEQSIKQAINQFVFMPNIPQTWAAVTAMISNFLTGLWQQGGLIGDTASDAYTVACGLGSTMTPQDILNGYMIVQVTLQMIRPAEFIELTFKQHMEGAG